MSLYPSLEDMKVDQMARAQIGAIRSSVTSAGPSAPTEDGTPYPLHPTEVPSAAGNLGALYPSLQEYMGLELTPEMIAANMPEYAVAIPQPSQVATTSATSSGHLAGMVAPLSGQSLGLARAEVTHGIRQVTLCKDKDGKVGLRVRAINKGVFVCLVQVGSPAALAGLRFGDQVLQINGENVAGFTMDKVHSIFKKADNNSISLAIRDRPFERTLTMHKGSSGHVGFQYKDGRITAIVKDSSAARNGLLTDHNLLEINGQNVVGLKDKEITKIIDEGGNIVTVTIMPSFLYDHIMKHMASSLVKKMMDHSVPDL